MAKTVEAVCGLFLFMGLIFGVTGNINAIYQIIYKLGLKKYAALINVLLASSVACVALVPSQLLDFFFSEGQAIKGITCVVFFIVQRSLVCTVLTTVAVLACHQTFLVKRQASIIGSKFYPYILASFPWVLGTAWALLILVWTEFVSKDASLAGIDTCFIVRMENTSILEEQVAHYNMPLKMDIVLMLLVFGILCMSYSTILREIRRAHRQVGLDVRLENARNSTALALQQRLSIQAPQGSASILASNLPSAVDMGQNNNTVVQVLTSQSLASTCSRSLILVRNTESGARKSKATIKTRDTLEAHNLPGCVNDSIFEESTSSSDESDESSTSNESSSETSSESKSNGQNLKVAKNRVSELNYETDGEYVMNKWLDLSNRLPSNRPLSPYSHGSSASSIESSISGRYHSSTDKYSRPLDSIKETKEDRSSGSSEDDEEEATEDQEPCTCSVNSGPGISSTYPRTSQKLVRLTQSRLGLDRNGRINQPAPRQSYSSKYGIVKTTSPYNTDTSPCRSCVSRMSSLSSNMSHRIYDESTFGTLPGAVQETKADPPPTLTKLHNAWVEDSTKEDAGQNIAKDEKINANNDKTEESKKKTINRIDRSTSTTDLQHLLETAQTMRHGETVFYDYEDNPQSLSFLAQNSDSPTCLEKISYWRTTVNSVGCPTDVEDEGKRYFDSDLTSKDSYSIDNLRSVSQNEQRSMGTPGALGSPARHGPRAHHPGDLRQTLLRKKVPIEIRVICPSATSGSGLSSTTLGANSIFSRRKILSRSQSKNSDSVFINDSAMSTFAESTTYASSGDRGHLDSECQTYIDDFLAVTSRNPSYNSHSMTHSSNKSVSHTPASSSYFPSASHATNSPQNIISQSSANTQQNNTYSSQPSSNSQPQRASSRPKFPYTLQRVCLILILFICLILPSCVWMIVASSYSDKTAINFRTIFTSMSLIWCALLSFIHYYSNSLVVEDVNSDSEVPLAQCMP